MKKSDKAKEALLEQLRKTPILQIACEKVGISRVTLYRWRSENKEFSKAVDDAMLEGRLLVNDLAESQLIGAIKDRNISAIVTWLRHNHATYKARLELEGSLKVVEEMSPQQKELFKKASKLAGMFLTKNSI